VEERGREEGGEEIVAFCRLAVRLSSTAKNLREREREDSSNSTNGNCGCSIVFFRENLRTSMRYMRARVFLLIEHSRRSHSPSVLIRMFNSTYSLSLLFQIYKERRNNHVQESNRNFAPFYSRKTWKIRHKRRERIANVRNMTRSC